VRILFCGDCFPASHSLLKERLRAGEDEITVCNGANLREALSKADVVIPMMTVLDAPPHPDDRCVSNRSSWTFSRLGNFFSRKESKSRGKM
jgi:hypothetical protein